MEWIFKFLYLTVPKSDYIDGSENERSDAAEN